MIARVSRYRVSAVERLADEVVTLARARLPSPTAHAEFFFVDSAGGEGLSVVLADHDVTPVVELRTPPSDVRDYSVHLLQLGGPCTSGVVDVLLARVVRCASGAVADLSFNGRAVPASPAVWARAILVADDREVLALAVASEHAPLVDSLRKFGECPAHDYDDVACHFLGRG